MLEVNFGTVKTILCLGAHSDDIEIGCGGTLLQLVERYPEATFHWVVFGCTEERAHEAESSAHAYLEGVSSKNILLRNHRDGFFPYEGAEIKEFFEELKREVKPDLILSHYGQDLHQDHRVISELTWNTFRSHLILEYEIPKYDGGLGSPNFFVPLDEETCRRKVRLALEHFKTQKNKGWFTEDTFMGLMRLRGVEMGASFAEAFYARKLCYVM